MVARARHILACGTWIAMLLSWCVCSFALDPSTKLSQYAHTAWRIRDGFSLGTIFAMAQTHDGYLWLGSEFGLFRFDGIRAVQWQPPEGQRLPSAPYSLLVTRDGTLWIGTFAGLMSWNGSKLTQYPEIGELFVTSLLEDRQGTVWAGILGRTSDSPSGELCAIRSGQVQCQSENGAFGTFVWSLAEDSSGNLWVGAESGVWRWKSGPPKRYPTPGVRVGDLTTSEDGTLLIGISGRGLNQILDDKLKPYPIRSADHPKALLPEIDVDSNKLLRDRDGGLWIGTHERGLIHIHDGRTDVFTKSDGLSGNIIAGLFEDHEGNVWVSTVGGLDRFRGLPVVTTSAREGLSSDATRSVLATKDGSIWVATREGLTKWKNGQTTIFRKGDGLPDDYAQSLFEDGRGRVWVSTANGIVYFDNGRFIRVTNVPSTEIYSMAGDNAGNVWLSGNRGLSHLRDGRFVENFPWSALGRHQQAKVVLFDPDQGGLWLAFWVDGGVLYFKDGQVRTSYSTSNGLGKGPVGGIQRDTEGALWAAIEGGGLSRIKDGRVATLTTRNGLPCDTVHWSIEDDDHSLWLYTACGLVRIASSEVQAWIADPKRRISSTLWDGADGVRFGATSPAYFNPPVAKTRDGKLWFLSGAEGVSVVDPHQLALNKLPPPIRIEQIVADKKTYWQSLSDAAVSTVHLPARIHDVQIDYTALSFVAPEKVHFKYKLDGQDGDWREVVNHREAQYSN
ncbi:MAG TPA: two-component regulator propeller domain-containing protein, partial [Terriglobales bacterium]|nr:two-component regulator propeller domain-containing protein [Terriglobales bacterium]